MASVGLSKSYYAIYSASNGTVTYSNGALLGKAVECSIELEDNDADAFYADNGPAESTNVFAGGTLTITNDSLPLTPVAAVLGLTPATVTTPSGSHLSFPADLTTPYVGYGTIRKDITGGTASYMAIVLYKVKFKIPNMSLSTQGETVEFNGQEFEAQIFRDDASPAKWMDWGVFASEADAETYIQTALNITASSGT